MQSTSNKWQAVAAPWITLAMALGLVFLLAESYCNHWVDSGKADNAKSAAADANGQQPAEAVRRVAGRNLEAHEPQIVEGSEQWPRSATVIPGAGPKLPAQSITNAFRSLAVPTPITVEPLGMVEQQPPPNRRSELPMPRSPRSVSAVARY